MAFECEKALKRRRLQKDQKKLKCKDQMYFPSKFSCYSDKPTKKRKFKAKKKKRRQIKKTSKPFKPFKKKKKFFKEKGMTETTKPASKQIQKQECKCWNCNEKGRFTNECPNQLNFAGMYSNELFEQIEGYEEVSLTDIESEDEIFVFAYLSSSEDNESDNWTWTTK